MVNFSSALVAIAIAATAVTAMPAAAPAPTAAPNIKDAAAKRSTTCTFTNASQASKSKASCATIVLDSIAVPSGTTLDMTDLTDGTHL